MPGPALPASPSWFQAQRPEPRETRYRRRQAIITVTDGPLKILRAAPPALGAQLRLRGHPDDVPGRGIGPADGRPLVHLPPRSPGAQMVPAPSPGKPHRSLTPTYAPDGALSLSTGTNSRRSSGRRCGGLTRSPQPSPPAPGSAPDFVDVHLPDDPVKLLGRQDISRRLPGRVLWRCDGSLSLGTIPAAILRACSFTSPPRVARGSSMGQLSAAHGIRPDHQAASRSAAARPGPGHGRRARSYPTGRSAARPAMRVRPDSSHPDASQFRGAVAPHGPAHQSRRGEQDSLLYPSAVVDGCDSAISRRAAAVSHRNGWGESCPAADHRDRGWPIALGPL
jgi:hypothetical protein